MEQKTSVCSPEIRHSTFDILFVDESDDRQKRIMNRGDRDR